MERAKRAQQMERLGDFYEFCRAQARRIREELHPPTENWEHGLDNALRYGPERRAFLPPDLYEMEARS